MCVQGCIELLKRSGVKMSGKTAAVVGRSNIVGLPVALLLQNEDATVTMVHSRTPNAGQRGCILAYVHALHGGSGRQPEGGLGLPLGVH